MMRHNALEERLNAVRAGKPIPRAPASFQNNPINRETPKNPKVPNYKNILITEGYKLFTVFAASLLYGYGAKAIFSTDWSFIGILGVGFIVNHILTGFSKLLSK